MLRKFILKNLSFALIFSQFLTSKINASIIKRDHSNDECYEVMEYIRNQDKYFEFSCDSDENGKVDSIDFRNNNGLEFFEKFPVLNNVKHLNLREAKFDQNFLNIISKLTNLESIDCQECDFILNTEDDSLKNLKNIKSINIWDYGSRSMEEIPEYIYSLSSLKSLKINNQRVTYITDSISKLKNLESLIIGEDNSPIKGISNKLCDLGKLKEVIIGSMDIYIKVPSQCCEKFNICYVDSKISTNGKCGKENGICPEGQCCSKYGQCGKSDEHCLFSNGCKSEFGTCYICRLRTTRRTTTTTNTSSPTIPVSTNGKCGKENGECPEGQCCSKYGYCGTSEKHCLVSKGCQSEFGQCITTTTTTTTSTTTTTTKTSSPTIPVSTNGKCGKENGECPEGQCCSKYGYCGESDEHCLFSNGCQSEFGRCYICRTTHRTTTTTNTSSPTIPVSTNGKCGKENGKCPEGQCCSKYGYCGTSEKHCLVSKGCQSEFGQCTGTVTTTTTTTKKSTTTKKTTIKSAKTTTNKSTSTNSHNGKCGHGIGKCPEGQCCSKYGYCGKTSDYCGKGCQSEFGKCN